MVVRIGSRQPARNYLREWRENRGLTQQQLADRMNTNKENISRWETRKRFMDEVSLAEAANALDIEVLELFRSPDAPSISELRAAFEAVEAFDATRKKRAS